MSGGGPGSNDYEGETIVEARDEVAGWMDAPSSRPELSAVVMESDHARGAVLASELDGDAFVGFVMIRADAKGDRVATRLLASALDDMQHAGYGTCRAFITGGNTPSGRLFAAAGFRRAEARPDRAQA